MAVVNIEKQVQESVKNLPDYDYMLGRTLMQPFRPANSGSRALMNSVHVEHLMVQNNSEVPIIQTGYETEFGKKSSSYVKSDANYRVLYKVEKFEHVSGHYYLIVQDIETDEYDVIERIAFKHNTESYGYRYNNNILDSLKPGSVIAKGDLIKTSIGFDEYGNKMNGTNLLTVYMSCGKNMEDSVIISETAAKKLETSLVKNTSITINDNDVLLNLYGDENVYKTFPDIGEPIKNGIFTSIRRLENNNMLFSLSQARLRDSMISDRNILMDGVVADISVYCNNPEALGDSHYNQQLYYYYKQEQRFCKEINDIVGPLAMNCKLSYNLKKLYANCRDIIAGKQFFKDKLFNNVIMDVTVIQNLPMSPGDKMTDRYGGKGVVSVVVPDEMMPMLDNGKQVEVIKNQSTCINRENIGQLHEQSLTFIGMRIVDYFKTGVLTYSEMARMWYDFVSMVEKDEADYAISAIDFYDEEQSKAFIDSIIEDESIILSIKPFSTTVDIDTIAAIYKKFPWIKPYKVYVPMKSSTGDYRFVAARRPLVAGMIYNYRLKQYAEEKFSVTSLAATNLKNLNTKSKANKVYETKFTKTPIMFGPMETGDLAHLGMEYVVMNLMIYSSSPQARRLFEQLLVGDPYDIDIKLDMDSKNRNAEIINALLKTIGLQLVFTKTPKVRNYLCKNILAKDVPNHSYKPKTNIRDYIGHDDEIRTRYSVAKNSTRGECMAKSLMCKTVKKDDKKDN